LAIVAGTQMDFLTMQTGQGDRVAQALLGAGDPRLGDDAAINQAQSLRLRKIACVSGQCANSGAARNC
jgi:hypothetical protein